MLRKGQQTHAARLQDSRAAWEAAKDSNGGNYRYLRYSHDSDTGLYVYVQITVKNGKVIERKCHKYSVRGHIASWVEEKGSVGSHSDCHPAETMDELYDECEDDVLTQDEDDNEISLELDEDGLLKKCAYTTAASTESCLRHIHVNDCHRGVILLNLVYLDENGGVRPEVIVGGQPATKQKAINKLRESRRRWKRDGHKDYNYVRSNSGMGYNRRVTKITVENGNVVKREYTEFDQIERSRIRKHWVEEDDMVGRHKDGYDAVTVEVLYSTCKELITEQYDYPSRISLDFYKNGTLKKCVRRPKNCYDWCGKGVVIEELILE